MTNATKGFASMSKERRVKIAAMGGIASHKKGKAHTWTREEAIAAGKIGGAVRAKQTRK